MASKARFGVPVAWVVRVSEWVQPLWAQGLLSMPSSCAVAVLFIQVLSKVCAVRFMATERVVVPPQSARVHVPVSWPCAMQVGAVATVQLLTVCPSGATTRASEWVQLLRSHILSSSPATKQVGAIFSAQLSIQSCAAGFMGITVSVAWQAVQVLVPVPVAVQVAAFVVVHALHSWVQLR
jgi:hypothetical protein